MAEIAKVPRNVKQTDFRGKRRKRRAKTRNKRIAYGDVMKQVMSDVLYIKSQFNAEDKWIDIANGGTNILNSQTLVLLNGMATGNTSVTRVGQSIKAVDLQFNLSITVNSSATASFLRCIILRDEQPNGAAPSAANILNVGGNFLSPRNVGYNNRFHVFYDELFAVCLNGPQNKVISFIKPFGFHTNYNTGSAGDITDITKNSLYLVLLSNESTNGVVVSYYSRFSFLDN